MKKIKEKLIKLLGGFTFKEYQDNHFDFSIDGKKIPVEKFTSIHADSKSYIFDNDTMEYEKNILAQKIGERMLDYDLIQFDVRQKQDKFGVKICR